MISCSPISWVQLGQRGTRSTFLMPYGSTSPSRSLSGAAWTTGAACASAALGFPALIASGLGLSSFASFAEDTTNGCVQNGHLIFLPNTSVFGLNFFSHSGHVTTTPPAISFHP